MDPIVYRAKDKAVADLRTYIATLDASRNTTMLEAMIVSLLEAEPVGESHPFGVGCKSGPAAFVNAIV